MSAPGRTAPPKRGPRRPVLPERLVRPFRDSQVLRLVVGFGLGGFALGYVLVWLLFFPGFGRSSIVTVPDLRDRPLAAATGALEELGLSVERAGELPNPRIARGRVLAQDPLPGQEVSRGSAVRLVLSAGPARNPVPRVVGLSLDDARALLERSGFTARVDTVADDAPAGRVLGTAPEAGTAAPTPGVVTVRVSRGPPFVAVPSVVSLPEPEARARLQAAGLRLGTVTYDPASAEPLGGIASQRPAAGDSLRRGGAVSVVISGTDPNPAPPDTAAPPAEPAPEPEPPAEPAPEPPNRG